MNGSQQLKAWMKRSTLNQREASIHLGIHYTTLNKLLAGSRPPGRETAIDIEAKTGIPVAAWTIRVGKRRKTVRAISRNANVGGSATHV